MIRGLLALLLWAFGSLASAQQGPVTPGYTTNGSNWIAVSPTSPLPVTSDSSNDGDLFSGTCSTSCLSASLISVDTAGKNYNSIVIQTTSQGSGTLLTQFSNDNTNWTNEVCAKISSGANSPPSFIFTGPSFLGETACPVYGRYFRIQFTAYTSGTFSVVAYGRSSPSSGVYTVQGMVGVLPYPQNFSNASQSVPVTASSGNVANAVATATLAGAASRTTYISSFSMTASGATVGSVVTCTLTNTITGTMSYTFTFPTGVGVGATPLVVDFNPAIPANATNTAIIASCPAGGTGNTNATLTSAGFQL